MSNICVNIAPSKKKSPSSRQLISIRARHEILFSICDRYRSLFVVEWTDNVSDLKYDARSCWKQFWKVEKERKKERKNEIPSFTGQRCSAIPKKIGTVMIEFEILLFRKISCEMLMSIKPTSIITKWTPGLKRMVRSFLTLDNQQNWSLSSC